MSERYRIPEPKDGELRIYWGKSETYDAPQVCYSWDDGCSRCDAGLMNDMLRRQFKCSGGSWDPCIQDELVRRGYDLSTIRFSIRKKR